MSRRVTRAYVRQYNADKVEQDQRKGRLNLEAVRYGREAYERYRERESDIDKAGSATIPGTMR